MVMAYGKRNWKLSRYIGVHPDYLSVENATIIEGRFINENDFNEQQWHVIGQKK
jgi:putative ABC transport system permease protein